jgi:hypothetical protein
MRVSVFAVSIVLQALLFSLQGFSQSSFSATSSISIRPASSTTSDIVWDEFDLLYEDRYFYIENRGLTRVLVELNGYQFKLAADPMEVRGGSNTYLIPAQGIVNMDIFPMLRREQNRMRIDARGPAGADASIIIADHLIVNRIDYIIRALSLPTTLQLHQNYPNPFNLTTKIVYEVPQNLSEGVNVQLVLFNLLGQKVRTLVNERNYPGNFLVSWDGADDRGEIVAAGVYLYRLVVGDISQTRRLVLLK